jgi:uncharacterized membrane protein
MNDSSDLKEDNRVLKCLITVTKNGSGFNVKYEPEKIPVFKHNTDVHFKIDANSSDDVEIDSVTITPSVQNQLIDEQITVNRKQYKVKDLNTSKGIFVLHFTFKDKSGKQLIANALKTTCDDEEAGLDVPQIDNNPPG